MVFFRLKNSNQLETSIQNGKTLLSSYENRLAREEVAPADIVSLEKLQRELAVRWLLQSPDTLQAFNTCFLLSYRQYAVKLCRLKQLFLFILTDIMFNAFLI